jgi:drug/metabolite transporter (DMT)-like permease
MTAAQGAGLAAALAAGLCFDGAVVLQAREARRTERALGLRPGLIAGLLRRPRWLAGLALGALGWPLQLAALALAPLTLVQPALACGLVLLVLAGSRLLGERAGTAELAAVGAIAAGVALAALLAPEQRDAPPPGAVLAAVAGALALAVLAPFARGEARAGLPLLTLSAGCAFAGAALAAKLAVVELARARPVAAAAWLAGAGAASITGLLVDTTAMQRFPATRVAPGIFALETALPVLAAPLFGEWAHGARGAALAGAVALVLAGGAALARSPLAAQAIRAH